MYSSGDFITKSSNFMGAITALSSVLPMNFMAWLLIWVILWMLWVIALES